jgi:DNA phosphorothioation-associated putative methyltransferase
MSRNSEALLETARRTRSEDTLVYLAMTNFRKNFRRREIPLSVKHDIKSFFGDLAVARTVARELLFAAGDAGEIDLACDGLDLGWQDSDALIVHRTLLDKLPPVLRVYVQCAAHRYGDPSQADLIKIHKRSGKVTFQHYDDFDGKPLPELQMRIKVNLRNLFVQVFDYAQSAKIQLLYFKERFVGKDHPGKSAMEAFSAKLRQIGFDEATVGYGPDKASLSRILPPRLRRELFKGPRPAQKT